MLSLLAIGDGEADLNEIEVIMDSLKVDGDFFELAANMPLQEAIDAIKTMTVNQKMQFAKIVLKLIKADGFIHPAEIAIYKGIFADTGITQILGRL